MKSCFLSFLLVCLSFLTFSQKDWYINFSPGLSYVPPMPLSIQQSEFSKLSFWARYKTEPLKLPIYYSYRLGFKTKDVVWEIEMNHLKIYLKNKPNEIQRFNITHGFNQLLVNKSYNKLKFGLGVVLAHPENTVRNFQLNEKKGIFKSGYYLAGPVMQLGLFRELYISKRFFLLAEGKVSFAYANVPIANGRAHVPVCAFHIQIGPAYWFIMK